jgi:AcrR family transcriptional regulator
VPKAFTPEEETSIKAKIVEKGCALFGKKGVRKTSIDELTQSVSIAKGSFYKFYESKEHLFLAILSEMEKSLGKQLEEIINQDKSPKETFKDFLRFHYQNLDTNPIIRIFLDQNEMNGIVRKVSEEKLYASREYQNSFLLDFINKWQKRGLLLSVDPQTLLALLKLMPMLGFYKGLAGPNYPQMIELMIDMLSEYLIVDTKK